MKLILEAIKALFRKQEKAVANKITAPAHAAVGQTIVVKSVVDGKPTEWEAVDFPSQDSGGGPDLVVAGRGDEVTLLQGSYESFMAKLKNHQVPSVVYMRAVPSDYEGYWDSFDFAQIGGWGSDNSDGVWSGVSFNIYNEARGFILYADNSVQWWEAD